jgi:hypothetical protein
VVSGERVGDKGSRVSAIYVAVCNVEPGDENFALLAGGHRTELLVQEVHDCVVNGDA